MCDLFFGKIIKDDVVPRIGQDLILRVPIKWRQITVPKSVLGLVHLYAIWMGFSPHPIHITCESDGLSHVMRMRCSFNKGSVRFCSPVQVKIFT